MLDDEKKKITIYSVAHEAGVSLATVSRVINDSSLVKEETRKKVEQAIFKLGYRPNAVAQGLALKKSTTIALVLRDNAFLSLNKTINGLLDVAKIYKYNILIYSSSSSLNEMDEIVENIIKSRADGIVVYNDILSREHEEMLESFSIPIVYVGHKSNFEKCCNVYVDYQADLYKITKDYLEKGYDDIILVYDRKNEYFSNQMLDGIKQAYSEYNRKFDGLIEIPEDYHNSYDFLLQYFASHKHKVVFTVRDSQAIAVLNACQEKGIRISEDTDLICAIDSRYIDMVRPQISSFEVPVYDMGALAMRVMTKMLNGEELNEKNYRLNDVYKKKASTKA